MSHSYANTSLRSVSFLLDSRRSHLRGESSMSMSSSIDVLSPSVVEKDIPNSNAASAGSNLARQDTEIRSLLRAAGIDEAPWEKLHSFVQGLHQQSKNVLDSMNRLSTWKSTFFEMQSEIADEASSIARVHLDLEDVQNHNSKVHVLRTGKAKVAKAVQKLARMGPNALGLLKRRGPAAKHLFQELQESSDPRSSRGTHKREDTSGSFRSDELDAFSSLSPRGLLTDDMMQEFKISVFDSGAPQPAPIILRPSRDERDENSSNNPDSLSSMRLAVTPDAMYPTLSVSASSPHRRGEDSAKKSMTVPATTEKRSSRENLSVQNRTGLPNTGSLSSRSSRSIPPRHSVSAQRPRSTVSNLTPRLSARRAQRDPSPRVQDEDDAFSQDSALGSANFPYEVDLSNAEREAAFLLSLRWNSSRSANDRMRLASNTIFTDVSSEILIDLFVCLSRVQRTFFSFYRNWSVLFEKFFTLGNETASSGVSKHDVDRLLTKSSRSRSPPLSTSEDVPFERVPGVGGRAHVYLLQSQLQRILREYDCIRRKNEDLECEVKMLRQELARAHLFAEECHNEARSSREECLGLRENLMSLREEIRQLQKESEGRSSSSKKKKKKQPSPPQLKKSKVELPIKNACTEGEYAVEARITELEDVMDDLKELLLTDPDRNSDPLLLMIRAENTKEALDLEIEDYFRQTKKQSNQLESALKSAQLSEEELAKRIDATDRSAEQVYFYHKQIAGLFSIIDRFRTVMSHVAGEVHRLYSGNDKDNQRGLCSSQFEIKSADSSSTEQYSSNGIQKSSLAYIDRVFGHSVGILTKKTGNSESNKTYPPEKGNSDGNSRIDVPTKSFSASSASNTLSPARIPKHHRRISNEDIALFDRESKDRLEDIASERNNYLELFDDPWLTVLSDCLREIHEHLLNISESEKQLFDQEVINEIRLLSTPQLPNNRSPSLSKKSVPRAVDSDGSLAS